jgi:hypothetical protein
MARSDWKYQTDITERLNALGWLIHPLQDDRWLISPQSRTCIVENLREAELFLSGIEIG